MHTWRRAHECVPLPCTAGRRKVLSASIVGVRGQDKCMSRHGALSWLPQEPTLPAVAAIQQHCFFLCGTALHIRYFEKHSANRALPLRPSQVNSSRSLNGKGRSRTHRCVTSITNAKSAAYSSPAADPLHPTARPAKRRKTKKRTP